MYKFIPLLAMSVAGIANAQDCDQQLQQLNNALSSGQITQLDEAAKSLQASSSCNNETVRQGLYRVSAALAKLAQQHYSDKDFIAAENILKHAPASHWAVQAILADIASDKKDYAKAAKLYNAALDTIGDPLLTPVSARLISIESQLAGLANEHMMLAGSVVSGIRRGGEASGVMRYAMRGIIVEDEPSHSEEVIIKTDDQKEVPIFLPIQFDNNQHTLNAAGVEEAKRIVEYLLHNKIISIRIEGHTDEVGTDAYNLELSQRRAHTVKQYLQNHHVSTDVHTVGYGESKPPQYTPSRHYDLHQKRAIARRVELIILQ